MARRSKSSATKRGAGYILVNVLGGVLCLIFIPVILCNVILIARSYMDTEKLPMVFGFSPVIVMSGSMYPTFSAGDMILLQETDPTQIEEGDVICYFADNDKNTAITHRVVDIQTGEDGAPVFVTRGDANNVEDRIGVTPEMVQGKYTGFYIAGLGTVAVFLQSPLGMVLCIVCPLALILLWDGIRRVRSSKRRAKTERGMEEELERLRAQVAQNEAQRGSDDSEL